MVCESISSHPSTSQLLPTTSGQGRHQQSHIIGEGTTPGGKVTAQSGADYYSTCIFETKPETKQLYKLMLGSPQLSTAVTIATVPCTGM